MPSNNNNVISIWAIIFITVIGINPLYVHAQHDSIHNNHFAKCDTDKEKLIYLADSSEDRVIDFIRRNEDKYYSFIKRVEKDISPEKKYLIKRREVSALFLKSKYHSAVPAIYDLLSQKEFVTEKDSVDLLLKLRICFIKLLNYPKVFEIHNLLVKMSRNNPIIKGNNFGIPLSSVYIDMGLYDDGLLQLKKEYEEDSENFGKYKEANYLNNVGVVLLKKFLPDSAIVYFTKSKQAISVYLKESPNDKYCIFFYGLLQGNIGQALMIKKQYKEAIPLLVEDINSSKRTGYYHNASISSNELVKCYLQLNNLNAAASILDSLTNLFQEIDVPDEYLLYLKLKSDLLSRQGNYIEANKSYREYIELEDSIRFSNNKIMQLNQQISFETNMLQQKIFEQEKELATRHEQVLRQKFQHNLLLSILILLTIIILLAAYFIVRIKRREIELSEKNNEISAKSIALENTLKEKEVLFKEVHHRVKNNMQIIMSLLKLQSGKINNKALEEYFEEARNRIQSMALVHEFLYKKERIDLLRIDKYIIQLSEEILKSYNYNYYKIELKTDCHEILLDMDTAVPLGLIVNELVTNSVKHAFEKHEGQISISLKENADSILLSVCDNGMGLPEDFDTRKENSLGMELIQLLSEQINAKVEISSGNGLMVNIIIPKTKA